MSAALRVVSPGMLATIQDLGRPGRQHEGIPVSGAMDPFALEAGNALLGNPGGAAAIEVALVGPAFMVESDALVCFTGADMGAEVGGRRAPTWTVVAARAGEEVRFTGRVSGTWAYLCVGGGIDVPPVLGSRSTCLRAGFGGMDGRPLRAGDLLRGGAGPAASPASREGTAMDRSAIPGLPGSIEARAVPGPEEALLPAAARDAFWGSAFRVSPQSDRVGYRLAGPRVEPAAAAELPSEGTAAGLVQVPPGGEPIVLMADRQPTGGYARIAVVASVDVARIAQVPPGGEVRFRRVTVEEARAAAVRQRAFLDDLTATMRQGLL